MTRGELSNAESQGISQSLQWIADPSTVQSLQETAETSRFQYSLQEHHFTQGQVGRRAIVQCGTEAQEIRVASELPPTDFWTSTPTTATANTSQINPIPTPSASSSSPLMSLNSSSAQFALSSPTTAPVPVSSVSINSTSAHLSVLPPITTPSSASTPKSVVSNKRPAATRKGATDPKKRPAGSRKQSGVREEAPTRSTQALTSSALSKDPEVMLQYEKVLKSINQGSSPA